MNPKFCTKCGNSLPPGVDHCPACGASVSDMTAYRVPSPGDALNTPGFGPLVWIVGYAATLLITLVFASLYVFVIAEPFGFGKHDFLPVEFTMTAIFPFVLLPLSAFLARRIPRPVATTIIGTLVAVGTVMLILTLLPEGFREIPPDGILFTQAALIIGAMVLGTAFGLVMRRQDRREAAETAVLKADAPEPAPKRKSSPARQKKAPAKPDEQAKKPDARKKEKEKESDTASAEKK